MWAGQKGGRKTGAGVGGQLGGVLRTVRQRKVGHDGRHSVESGVEEVQYFYSYGTENDDLSSMHLGYGFKGRVGSVAPR